MSRDEIDPRRLVGVHAERVTNVSSTDYPGHYHGEDNSWKLETFEKVRRKALSTRAVVDGKSLLQW